MHHQNLIADLSRYMAYHKPNWLIANAQSDDIQKSLDTINHTIRTIIEYLIHLFSVFVQN